MQGEPIMRVWAERNDVTGFSNWPKQIAAKHFHRHVAREARKVQFHRLGKAREIHYHQNDFVLVTAKKGKNLGIVWIKKFKRAPRKRLEIFPHGDDSACPPEQRGEIFLLIFHVDGFVVILRVDRNRQIKLLRIRSGKSAEKS